ncbi:MAG: DUF4375 domain-containing protein [uncultured Sulfurovum sp.]|uniref:DUF4375 domain-containing protein n=1 Tax=uncultured Sulfurovum sp. TaxID=269237 RepID=A0A6S6TG89_9BACT|nr:MAG: DUF4375 domain-containing protein [uncultured Sulfurovum sp.]
MKMEQILISDTANQSDELYAVVYSNSKIIAYLLAQGIKAEEIHQDALASYYVDYYFSQVNTGGFSKFVHNSEWDSEINSRVAYGLKAINSMEHLGFFLKKENEINQIAREKLEEYFLSDFFDESPLKAELDDRSFFSIEDEIVDLNGQWLKEHKDTKVLSMDEIFLVLEEILGKPIQR